MFLEIGWRNVTCKKWKVWKTFFYKVLVNLLYFFALSIKSFVLFSSSSIIAIQKGVLFYQPSNQTFYSMWSENQILKFTPYSKKILTHQKNFMILFLFPPNFTVNGRERGGGILETIFILFLILFLVFQNIVSVNIFLFCFPLVLILLLFHSGISKNNVPISVIILFLVILEFLYHFYPVIPVLILRSTSYLYTHLWKVRKKQNKTCI